jgi:hypothetical protein
MLLGVRSVFISAAHKIIDVLSTALEEDVTKEVC